MMGVFKGAIMEDMTPMEAWHIISQHLTEFYSMRFIRAGISHTRKDILAEVMCYQALKEMQERSNSNERKSNER